MTMTVTYGVNPGVDGSNPFQVNTFELGEQILPDVLGLSNGGFVVAHNNGSPTNGLMTLAFYNADHQAIGGIHTPYDGDTDAVGRPKLAELAGGNVLVVWDDDNTTDGNGGPRGAIFLANGGGEVAVDIDLSPPLNITAFTDLDVAALDNGGFVVSTSYAGEIYIGTFDSVGTVVTSFFGVNTTAAGSQVDTQVTVLEDGAIAVIWTDTGPSDQQIRGRIYEANGVARTAEFNASPGGGDNTQPAVAALKNGGFALVYTDTGWGESGPLGNGITLQIVDANGGLGATQHVNVVTPSDDEVDADVTVLENGFIVVSWSYPYSATDDDVHGRVYGEDGVAVTEPFSISGNAADESSPAISALMGGNFISAFQYSITDGDGGQIAAKTMEISRLAEGDAAPDTFTGDVLRDVLIGNGGGDTLDGGAGADTIQGGIQNDSLLGGLGSDVLEGGLNDDTIRGGAGNDRIYAATKADPGASPGDDMMFGDAGADRLVGSAGDDTINGGLQNDKVNGGAGNDNIDGGEGADKLKGQSGSEMLEGGAGSDTLNGGVGDDYIFGFESVNPNGDGGGDQINGANGDDTIFGAAGADLIVGLAGKDVLFGGVGNDDMSGGTGKDRLYGGGGVDTLNGGADKDTFAWQGVAESVLGAEDIILDLGNLDVIDLSEIDAKSGNPGDDHFTLVAAFTGHKGELIVHYNSTGIYSGYTSIEGDVNGDGAADFRILATGDKHNFGNFVL